MRKTFVNFIYEQWSTVPPVEKVDLTGKTVMVVGGNGGIGFEAAKHFATMNPQRLIIGCRNEAKGQDAAKEIEKSTGFNNSEVWLVDLSSFASITGFVEKVEKECKDLNILVMNAGILTKKYETTDGGWETTIQVNHLSTSLLSILLVPRLLDTGRRVGTPSRLVVVSSEVHYWANIEKEVQDSARPLEKLSSTEYCTPAHMGQRYNDSKLLNVLFVRSLSDRLQSIAPLIVDAVNPGFCYSNLRDTRSMSSVEVVFNFIMEKLFAWTPEQGARQLVWAAVGGKDNEEKMKGAYINKAQIAEVSDFVLSEDGKNFQEKVWQETIDILAKASPKVETVIQEYLAK
ncbi:NAD(P)-binding protein [Gyrodon lividus]|nr:NAD(P)-binding protein [Gyrodon lividus]